MVSSVAVEGSGGAVEVKGEVIDDERLANLVAKWKESKAGGDKQRALADALLQEAQRVVEEAERREAEEESRKEVKKRRVVASMVPHLVGNPKQLHMETLQLMKALNEV